MFLNQSRVAIDTTLINGALTCFLTLVLMHLLFIRALVDVITLINALNRVFILSQLHLILSI
jgi:hypothetical protein